MINLSYVAQQTKIVSATHLSFLATQPLGDKMGKIRGQKTKKKKKISIILKCFHPLD